MANSSSPSIRWQDGTDGTVFSTLFDREIKVMLSDGGSQAYAQCCANVLNSLSQKLIDDFCAASIRYCNGFLEAVGEPLREFPHRASVLKLIEDGMLIVPETPDPQLPVVHMELNCDWESEHGLELIIRDSRLIYLGGYDGYDPSQSDQTVYGNYAIEKEAGGDD